MFDIDIFPAYAKSLNALISLQTAKPHSTPQKNVRYCIDKEPAFPEDVDTDFGDGGLSGV